MLYIFDKDGTIVKPVGPDGNRAASSPSEQVLYDGVADKCNELKGAGHILAIASNQGGVAFGLVTRDNAIGMMKDASDKIGASLFALCSCHPNGEMLGAVRNSVYRKPGPGMIQYLMDALGFAPQDTVFVGDLDSDRLAAEAAGVNFEWAKDFFNRPEEVLELKVEVPSTIDSEEPFDDDEDDENEDEEDYWDQWLDEDDEEESEDSEEDDRDSDTNDDDDDDSASGDNDGDADANDDFSDSADVSGDTAGSSGGEASATGSIRDKTYKAKGIIYRTDSGSRLK